MDLPGRLLSAVRRLPVLMLKPFRTPRFSTFLLTLAIIAILLACRTVDLITNAPEESSVALQVEERATETRPRPRPSLTPFVPQQQQPPQVATFPTEEPFLPTEIPLPTDEPFQVQEQPEPEFEEPPPPPPQPTPTDAGPTATPGPTPCPKTYCVVYRGCQPDSGNTLVEGYVYKNGVPENGVAVRVALSEGAYPLVDDFVTGNSTVNPGQPDPNTPGYYKLQIVPGAAREGNWWVFVIDTPNGTKQISEAQLIHTNDDGFNPANCQHAFVDFVR